MADQGSVRRALVDAGLVVGVTAGLQMVVGIGGAALAGVPFPVSVSAVTGVVTGSWGIWVVFAALVVLIALSGWSRRLRLRLTVPAAIMAWLIAQTVNAALAGMPLPDALLWGLLSLPAFAVVAFVAGLIVAALPGAGAAATAESVGAPPVEGPPVPAAVPIVRAIALGGAILLTLSLPWQWFRIYFRLFGGGERTATAEQGAQFLATFLLATALAILALVLASRQRRGSAIAGSVVTIFVLLAVGFVFQVPSGSVWLEAPPPPDERPLPPCYTERDKSACGG